MKYMSSKFNYFAPKTTTQHSLKSTQYTFKHCTKIFELFKEVIMMWFCGRGSQTCLRKMVHQMTILTDFGNLHISLKRKDILPKKLSSSFCNTLGYLP